MIAEKIETKIETKIDAVERLAPLKRLFGKIPSSEIVDSEANIIDTCGVVICDNFAYIANAHFVGKIHVPDKMPPDNPTYWDLKAREEMEAIKKPPLDREFRGGIFYSYIDEEWKPNKIYEDFVGENKRRLKRFFFKWRSNLLKIRKDDVLRKIDNIFGKKDNDKIKYMVLIKNNLEYEKIEFKIMPLERQGKYHEFSLPFNPSSSGFEKNYTPPGMCSANLYYFYHILKVFKEYDVVDLCFDNSDIPVIMKGVNPRVDWKPDIKFAIGQCKAFYDYPEKKLY